MNDLPDDVQRMIQALNHQSALLPAACYGSAADMLERLAREIEALEDQIRKLHRNLYARNGLEGCLCDICKEDKPGE